MSRRRKLTAPIPAMPTICKTCIFRPPGERAELAPGRLAEIQAYLLRGTVHQCHTADGAGGTPRACRGGREFQLTMWARMGLIAEPTDAALADAMRAAGVTPIPEGD